MFRKSLISLTITIAAALVVRSQTSHTKTGRLGGVTPDGVVTEFDVPGNGGPTGLRTRQQIKVPTLDADASRLAALLIAYIRPVCALFAPCHAGASTPIIGTFIC